MRLAPSLICILFCLLSRLAAAQSVELPIPGVAKPLMEAFGKPLHPIVGGVASGGGIGVGVGYDTPKDHGWFQNASALVTFKRYWSVDGETGYQTPKARIGMFGGIRDMGRLAFFGFGPQSRLADHTNFHMRENILGVKGWFRPSANVRLGGKLEAYKPQLNAGSSPAVPSIETLFTPANVPGLNATPLFERYRGFAELTYPVVPADPGKPNGGYQGYQGTYQLALETVRGHDGGRYDFHRFEIEVRQRFDGFRPGQRLTLHGLMAVANPDAVVPFYLQYTLGGGGGLSAFRHDSIGGDATKSTLRGFQNYRFRDRDILLLQAEYRLPIHGPVDGSIFYDAGQVASRAGDLFKGRKQGTGFSVSYMRKGAALARLDVGYGSGEGVHLFWGFGAFKR